MSNAAAPTGHRAPGRPWSLADAAEFLGVSQRTLTRLAEDGRLRLVRIGVGRGRVLVPDAEVQRLAQRGAECGEQ
jgi:excisionase family DNA binding protein